MKNPFLWYRIALSLCVVALLTLGVEYAKMRAEVFAGAEIYRTQTQKLYAARQELFQTQVQLSVNDKGDQDREEKLAEEQDYSDYLETVLSRYQSGRERWRTEAKQRASARIELAN